MRATFLSLLSIFAVSTNLYANEYCNDKATIGGWREGIKSNLVVNNIVGEFYDNQKFLIKIIDGLPVVDDENQVLSSMGIKPTKIIKLPGVEFYDIRWELSNLNLFIKINVYKGCISEIQVIKTNNNTIYARRNKMPETP